MNGWWKALTAAVCAWVCSFFGILTPWIAAVVAAMALDYITGIAAAWNAGELSSRIGIRGILKKLGYLVIIAVAMLADWTIATGGGYLGFRIETPGYLALLVIVWLLMNELISILENAGRLGVPYPAWLMKVLSHLRENAEQKGDELHDESLS